MGDKDGVNVVATKEGSTFGSRIVALIVSPDGCPRDIFLQADCPGPVLEGAKICQECPVSGRKAGAERTSG